MTHALCPPRPPPRRMMPGLLEGPEKMSKSDPNSAIFMEDSEGDVNVKIKKAYCPPQVGGAGEGAVQARIQGPGHNLC